MSEVGFIVLRCVTAAPVDRYWRHCYDCIRKYYPDAPIVIIDDGSRPEFLSEKTMTNTTVVPSEFPGRAEILPYYYYLQYGWFPRAIIIHDSIFVNAHVDLTFSKCRMLWEFEHDWDQVADETRIISALKDPLELLSLHERKTDWKGCFGAMCLIELSFLQELDTRYDLTRLLSLISSRYNRMSLERVWACILHAHALQDKRSLFGNIHQYITYGISFDQIGEYSSLPFIKVWSGR